MNRLIQSAMLIVALTSAPAWAQGKSDQKLMQVYGGVLAPDCSNYMLPQLKYLGDSLVVQDAGKAVLTGRNVKAAPVLRHHTATGIRDRTDERGRGR